MSSKLIRTLDGRRLSQRLAAPLRARDCEHGATAVEYALMVGLIALVIVAGVVAFGQGVSALFVIPAGVFGGP